MAKSRQNRIKSHRFFQGRRIRVRPDGGKFRQRKGRNGVGGYVSYG